MENKIKHLEFIQTTINRMAGNLFFLRGWVITLIAALIAVISKETNDNYLFYILIALIIIFWILDGYFLSQERLYRDLYNKVSKQDTKDINFSMDTNEFKKYKKNTIIYSMFSISLLIFYVPLFIIGILIKVFIK